MKIIEITSPDIVRDMNTEQLNTLRSEFVRLYQHLVLGEQLTVEEIMNRYVWVQRELRRRSVNMVMREIDVAAAKRD
jgi:hypothetical protein